MSTEIDSDQYSVKERPVVSPKSPLRSQSPSPPESPKSPEIPINPTSSPAAFKSPAVKPVSTNMVSPNIQECLPLKRKNTSSGENEKNQEQYAQKQSKFEYDLFGKTATAHANIDTEHNLAEKSAITHKRKEIIKDFEDYVAKNVITIKTNAYSQSNSSTYVMTPDLRYQWLLERCELYINNKNIEFTTLEKELKLLAEHNKISNDSVEDYIGEIEAIETDCDELRKENIQLETTITILQQNQQTILLNQDLQFFYLSAMMLIVSLYTYWFGYYGFLNVIEAHYVLVVNILRQMWWISTAGLESMKTGTDWVGCYLGLDQVYCR